MSDKLCKNCVNFCTIDDKYYFCDYEYWDNTLYEKALIFVPELFECNKFEEPPKD
jgi:hypothetical protein